MLPDVALVGSTGKDLATSTPEWKQLHSSIQESLIRGWMDRMRESGSLTSSGAGTAAGDGGGAEVVSEAAGGHAGAAAGGREGMMAAVDGTTFLDRSPAVLRSGNRAGTADAQNVQLQGTTTAAAPGHAGVAPDASELQQQHRMLLLPESCVDDLVAAVEDFAVIIV